MSTIAIPQSATSTWNIDPVHSVAEFKVKHMMISNVKGQFTGVKGVLTQNETDLTNSHVEAPSTRPPSTRAIRSAMRISRAPTSSTWRSSRRCTFKSTRITRSGDGEQTVAGDLTIHGITRNVVFTVEGPTAAGEGSLGQYPHRVCPRPPRSIAKTSA